MSEEEEEEQMLVGRLASRYGTTSSNDSANSAVSDLSKNSLSRDANDVWEFTWHRKEGNMTMLGEWSRRNSTERSQLVVLGPKADVPCVLLAMLLLLGPALLMLVYLLADSSDWQILVGGSAFVSAGLLCWVFFTDPGLVPSYKRAKSRDWTYCDYCESFRPPNCVHCAACGTCIAGYDHHCPWTGKCVGDTNRNAFKALNVSVSWLLALMFVVVLAFLPWAS